MEKINFKELKVKLSVPPGIQGKDEYFNSVVLLLLVKIDNEYNIVFQKRSSNIRQGGEICLPGGKHDEGIDASLEMTALRETFEELGILEEKINIIGQMDTIISLTGATIDVFIGVSDIGIDELKINPDEVEEVFFLPVSYFLENEPEIHKVAVEAKSSYLDKETGEERILLPVEELGLPKRYKEPWGGFKYKVLVYKTEKGAIWGITSRAIFEFIQKI